MVPSPPRVFRPSSAERRKTGEPSGQPRSAEPSSGSSSKGKGKGDKGKRKGKGKSKEAKGKGTHTHGDGMCAIVPTYVTRIGRVTTVGGMSAGERFISVSHLAQKRREIGIVQRPKSTITRWAESTNARNVSCTFQLHISQPIFQRQSRYSDKRQYGHFERWRGGTLVILIFHIGHAAGEYYFLRLLSESQRLRCGPAGLSRLSGRSSDAPLFHADKRVRQCRCVCSGLQWPPMVLCLHVERVTRFRPTFRAFPLQIPLPRSGHVYRESATV